MTGISVASLSGEALNDPLVEGTTPDRQSVCMSHDPLTEQEDAPMKGIL